MSDLSLPAGLANPDARLRLAGTRALTNGVPVELTPREREMLQVLLERAGRVVQREELYRAVWGGAMPYRDRSVDVLVKRIRRKLAAADPHVAYVHTHYGIGYRLSAAWRDVEAPVRVDRNADEGGIG
jgi:DNA-binding response OmpR family regulator